MKGIVVDASVARAAGETDVPVSRNCRDFLDTMRAKADCGCLLTPAVREEWMRHASKYGIRWLASMAAGSRVIERSPATDTHLRERLELCAEKIASGEPVQTRAVAAALIKDAHLLEAALELAEDGRRIVSLDEKVRRHLRFCAKSDGGFRDVVWVNPNAPEERVSDWISSGAPLEPHRMLGDAS